MKKVAIRALACRMQSSVITTPYPLAQAGLFARNYPMPTIAELSSSNAAANPTRSLFPLPARPQPATQPVALPAIQPKAISSPAPASVDSPFVGAWMQGDSHWTRCVRSQRRPSWIARVVMDLFFDWNWVERQL